MLSMARSILRRLVRPSATLAEMIDEALDHEFNAVPASRARPEEPMAKWVDAFATALQRDLIDADDFAER
jgi:hypothetical protein